MLLSSVGKLVGILVFLNNGFDEAGRAFFFDGFVDGDEKVVRVTIV